MKTKKNILNSKGGKYPSYRYASRENLHRKTTNYFWNLVDNLSYKIEKLAEFYETSIGKEYEKESEIFDISKDSNILHIGCGAYPITAITLARNNGVKVAGIDKNPKAVELAKSIVHEKNLHDKIIIEQGNGANYPVEKFDTIIVSGCAMPKIKILEHVFETARPKSKIIVRESDTVTRSVVECIDLHEDIALVKK